MGSVLSTVKDSLTVATNDAAEKFVSPFDDDICLGKEVSQDILCVTFSSFFKQRITLC